LGPPPIGGLLVWKTGFLKLKPACEVEHVIEPVNRRNVAIRTLLAEGGDRTPLHDCQIDTFAGCSELPILCFLVESEETPVTGIDSRTPVSIKAAGTIGLKGVQK
jgi:hypothetical protein